MTLSDHRKLIKEDQAQNLQNLIDIKGSMYGNAHNEISDKQREQRASQEISKIDTMFGDGKIKMHYSKFKEQADLILEADRK